MSLFYYSPVSVYCLHCVCIVSCVSTIVSLVVIGSHLHKSNSAAVTNEDISPDTTDNVPSLSCRFHYRHNTLPRGKTNVDYLHFLGKVDTYQDCADLCCQHGPKCQMGWLFKTKCFAVNCDKWSRENCIPMEVPLGAKYSSSLIVMSFSKNKLKPSIGTHLPSLSSVSSPFVPSPVVSSSSFNFMVSSELPVIVSSISTPLSSSPSVAMDTTKSEFIRETPHSNPHHTSSNHFRHKSTYIVNLTGK